MSRTSFNRRLSNLGDRLPSPRPSSPPAKGLTRVIKEMKTKVAAHTGISLSFVEFMGSSPAELFPVFPPSPRLSSDVRHRRMKSTEAFSPPSLLAQASAPSEGSQSHSGQDRGSEQEATTPDQQPAPRGSRLKHHVGGSQICKQAAKSMLLAMVVMGFLCTGKTTAMGVTTVSFALLRVILSVRSRGFKDFLSWFRLFFSPSGIPSNNLAEVPPQRMWEVVKTQAFEEKQGKENPNKEECNVGCNARRMMKKRLRSSLRSLSVQVPRKVFSPLTNSAPSSPVTSLQSPNATTVAKKTGIKSPSFARIKSLNRSVRGGHTASAPVSPCWEREEEESGKNSSRGVEVVMSPRGGEMKMMREKLGEASLYEKKSTAAIAMVLVTLGGLLHGRVAATLALSSCLLMLSQASRCITRRPLA